MPLSAGTRLGPYEIIGPLGAGGMGEVYKAIDTRLGRHVAIKLLHPSLAADPSFTARFANEARTLSRITHPNICVIHDVGYGDPTYIVLEYLEGQTLAERIARGPLSFEEVRHIGVEICRALDTAHRAGIVHRDLKPANVMLTKSGAKLLDFGLARENPTGSGDTTAIVLTKTGSVLGTAPYMSPEQLQGQPADARSDIFALGATLHEAATGRRAFEGPTPAAIASAIIATDPTPPSVLRPGLPPAFDAIILGCLAKEPETRWQSAHDVGRQLGNVPSLSSSGPVAVRKARKASTYLPWTLAALAALIAIATWVWRKPMPPAAAATVALEIAAPPGTSLLETVEGNALALSPDGSQLAWVGVDADRGTRIWLRSLARVDSHPLAGTEGASALFWSPDGKSIGFFANARLQRLDLQGTTPVTICSVPLGTGHTGVWGTDGQILFAPVQGDAIFSVSTAGGEPRKVIVANRAAGERRVAWPWFLADGKAFIYTARREGSVGWLMLARPGREPQRVAEIPGEAQYVDSGYVVFGRSGALLAQRFDPVVGRMVGDPLPLAPKVQLFAASGWGGFSASRTGTIAYLSSADQSHLAWADAAGKTADYIGAAGNYLDVRPTPDEQHALLSRIDATSGVYDLWSIDLARGTEERLTSGPSTNIGPVFSPDGLSFIYSKSTGGSPGIVRRILASGAEEQLAPAEAFQQAVSITKDGRTLLYVDRVDRGNWDLRTLPLEGAHIPAPLVATPFNEFDARLSPDDRVIAFVSDDTGRSEVYIAPFPHPSPKYRVSAQGGRLPRWSADSRTLFFLSGDGRLMSAQVALDGAVKASTPVSTFPGPPHVPWRDFAPMPGGRFLAIVPDGLAREQPMTVITNALR